MRNYDQVLETARKAFSLGKTRSVSFRKQQLKNLLRLFLENEKEILNALNADLRKCSFEGKLGECENLKSEVKHMLRNLDHYSAPETLPLNLLAFLDRGYIQREPFGVVLVIGTWNYPFNLSLQPLIGALAAGNCVILKPSEVAPRSAETMAKLLPKYLDAECYQVVLGGAEDTQQLLRHRFDYIFYTGSSSVGRIISTAAAVNLTPVTLELGGKSPCFIDDDADCRLAAKRILWGKVMNLGMTCIAPDYVLCSKQVETEFVKVAKEVLEEWYGPNLQKSGDLPRFPNQKQLMRLTKMLEATKGRVVVGGESNPEGLWLDPTIVVDVDGRDSLMEPQNEIFGPILPIVNVGCLEEAIQFINARPKPLALYIFARSNSKCERMLEQTSSGGACVNDVIWHNLWPGLPFGGVGDSGQGSYHGKSSFDTFSHKKSVLVRGFGYFSEKLGEARYPPYNDSSLRFFTFLVKYFEASNVNINHINSSHIISAIFGAVFLFAILYAFNLVCV
ncbi:unnamed protein product [Allacma fusca]|uniref:Aldehyde dehydrogenase n=1 Tax=Allacma fusca TaxID=39272 RepID=A0A8J2KGV4_9HEXA|nr:unnamed protein product [Allacma fusca]